MGDTPKKYHITDNGDIYKVNEDGSFTSMGNAEKMSSTNQTEKTISQSTEPSADDKPIKPFIEKKHRVLVIISVFLLVGISLFYLLHSPKASNIFKEEIASADTLVQSISDTPLAEAEQPIVDEQLENIHDIPKKEDAKVEANQSEKIELRKESENYAKSSNDIGEKETSQDVIDPNKVYSAVEVQADFPGGDRARLQWLRDNISWPRDVNGQQLHGDVELDFIIERDGSVSNVKVIYSENSELNSAAITLISSMPKWSPAMVNNQPVRSPMGITLFF